MTRTTITIEKWHTQAVVGVHPWEQERPRELYLTLRLVLKPGLSFAEDDLAKTVDYDLLTQEIAAMLASRSFQLIETVADLVLSHVMKHPLVESAAVEVDKPGAVSNAVSVSVERASL